MKTFAKKFLLILLGIFLSLIILELSLRFAGFAVSSYQQYKNNRALKNKSQYTIMCLGESTTAGEYPIQLQKILDKKYPNKFSVIDCGINGTILESILELSDKNIIKYNPNIVICMMGINNIFYKFDDTNYISKHKHITLKIHKLFFLLKTHITTLFKSECYANDNLFYQDNILNNAMKLIQQKEYQKAIYILENVLKTNMTYDAYVLLMDTYLELHNYEKCYEMALKGLETNWEKSEFYFIIFEITKYSNKFKFKFFVDKAIKEDIDIFKSNKKYWLYTSIQNYISDEQKNKILKILFNGDSKETEYCILAIDYLKQKDYKKAQEYFDKAEELRLNFPKQDTYDLYKQIVKKFVDNNIKVICMQYPVRSIEPLKEQLQNESYFDKITFISNEEIFKKALRTKSYDEIFVDQFAGDFGHCTNLGNTMIAENVVNCLEKLIN